MTQLPLLAATIVIGVAGTGAALISASGYKGDVEPVRLPLKDDPLFDESVDYSNPGFIAFGRKYKWYMVGQARVNRRWWTKTFNKLKNEQELVGKEFKNISYPWWFWGEESLNRVCRQAYIKYTKEVEGNKEDAQTDDPMSRKYREEDVWRYCSILSRKPSVIGNSGDYGSGKLGGDAELKTKLISTKDEANELFWKIRNQEFFEEIGVQSSLYKNEFFSDLFNKQMMGNPKTIKDRCEEAYGKAPAQESTEATPTKKEVLKYCSFADED